MALTDIMLRLGEILHGSNTELSPLPQERDENEESSKGSSSEQRDEEVEPQDTADSDEDSDSEEDAEGEGGDTEEEGEDSDESDDSTSSEGEDTDEDSDDTDEDSDDSNEGGDTADSNEGGDSDSEDTDEDSDDEGYDDFEDEDADSTEGGSGAGGAASDLDKENEFHTSLLDGLRADEKLLDNNEALSSAVSDLQDTDCEDGEKVWRPYDPSLDRITRPRGNKRTADSYHRQVKPLTAAIRAEFRARFLQARKPLVRHGVRRGKDLSERRLVESFVEIRSGVRPSRPDYRIDKKPDVSLALAVVGDESGSMGGLACQYAAMAMMSIAEAFDSLGSPVMCCGVRNGDRCYMGREERSRLVKGDYHRFRGVRIDLFKDWDESFKKAHNRFSAYTATGNTPLSDGIQFAMQELGQRSERFRVVLVLTDGMPNCSDVVRRQIRLAREAGIFVVGVGIDGAGSYVAHLFPEYNVDVPTLEALPKEMFKVLSSIMFPTRGQRSRFEGSFRRTG